MQTLTLVRGLPGSGKSTLARTLREGMKDNTVAVSADDFFYLSADRTGLECLIRPEHQVDEPVFNQEYWHRIGRSLESEDSYWMFSKAWQAQAHAWCIEVTQRYLDDGWDAVVHNTFTRRWEMEPYLCLSKDLPNIQIRVVSVYDGGCTDEELAERNSHNVPLDVIQRMRSNWEMDWRSASRDREFRQGPAGS